MTHEGATEHVLAPAHLFAIDLVRQGTAESVIGGAQRDERLPGVHVIHDLLLLGLRQCEQSCEKDDQIRRREVFEAGM